MVSTASSEKDARRKRSAGGLQSLVPLRPLIFALGDYSSTLGRTGGEAAGEYTTLSLTTIQNGRPYDTHLPSAISPSPGPFSFSDGPGPIGNVGPGSLYRGLGP